MAKTRTAALLIIVSALVALFSLQTIAAELLMFEEEGCVWCAKWDAEIGDIYPKTSKGKAAPLHKVDIHGPIPDFITKNGLIHYSPTFVLIEDGKEIGRITGYPGEDNFWWFLEELVKKL